MTGRRNLSTGGGWVKVSQRPTLWEAAFTEPRTNAMAMALEPLATKEDLQGVAEALRKNVEVLRIELRRMKWVGGAIGVAVPADLVSGFFS